MAKATLVIMAAGIGSRFGGGIKQLAAVGPSNEIIMDYSVYDAMEAGFDKVVFVIRKSIEKEFKEVIGNRIEKVIETKYVFQEVGAIPEKYQEIFKSRTKPWGTGQAILCCKDAVDEPFLVINADDYYGKEAYKAAYRQLTEHSREKERPQVSMVGFVLGNTLSDNGTVTRGICKTDGRGMLKEIKETYEIARKGDKACGFQEGRRVELPLGAAVSMNMWGMYPGFFHILEEGFQEFLENLPEDELKKEYLLPTIIGGLLRDGRIDVKVLKSEDQWFGVTYQEDKQTVIDSIRKLVDSGAYPQKLFQS